jgi:hypothetical protein
MITNENLDKGYKEFIEIFNTWKKVGKTVAHINNDVDSLLKSCVIKYSGLSWKDKNILKNTLKFDVYLDYESLSIREISVIYLNRHTSLISLYEEVKNYFSKISLIQYNKEEVVLDTTTSNSSCLEISFDSIECIKFE